jgi:spore coat protein H
MKEFTDQVFTSAKMNGLFAKYHALISPYVIGPEAAEQPSYTHLPNNASFTTALETLKQHVVTQRAAAIEYLK